MSPLDLSSLNRTTIGFDRIPLVLKSTKRLSAADAMYPPYNIEKLGSTRYRIVMALAGFQQDDISIVVDHQRLTVKGKMLERDDVEYLHRGIAGRPFARHFELADYVEVSSATFETGLLTIELKREIPEKLKPRKIEIREHGPRERSLATASKEAA